MTQPGRTTPGVLNRPLGPAQVVLWLVVVAIAVAGVLRSQRRREVIAQRSHDLAVAARDGQLSLVRSLVDQGADVNASGGSALWCALWSGHSECAGYLLAHGARTDVSDVGHIGNLLYEACSGVQKTSGDAAEQLRIVRRLVAEGQDVNCRPGLGLTPLFGPCAAGETAVAEELIAHGATVNITNFDGCTPLHWAAGSGRVDVVRLLLRYGANTHIRNKKGETPAQVAAKRGHPDVVRLLADPAKLPPI